MEGDLGKGCVSSNSIIWSVTLKSSSEISLRQPDEVRAEGYPLGENLFLPNSSSLSLLIFMTIKYLFLMSPAFPLETLGTLLVYLLFSGGCCRGVMA